MAPIDQPRYFQQDEEETDFHDSDVASDDSYVSHYQPTMTDENSWDPLLNDLDDCSFISQPMLYSDFHSSSPYLGHISNMNIDNFYHPFIFPVSLIDILRANAGETEKLQSDSMHSQSYGHTLKPWKELMDLDHNNNQNTLESERMDLDVELNYRDVFNLNSLFTTHTSTPVRETLQSEMSVAEIDSNPSPGNCINDKQPWRELRNLKKRKLEFMLGMSNKENQPNKKLRKTSVKKKQRLFKGAKLSHCEFCKANGEPSLIYKHHNLKDKKGRTLCPILRQIECPICFVDGDEAHTMTECPRRISVNGNDTKLSSIQRHLKCIQI